MVVNLTSSYLREYRGFERRTKDEWNELPDLATIPIKPNQIQPQ